LVPQAGPSSVCTPPGSSWDEPKAEGPGLDESAGGELDQNDD
jgi:hypothetical protein